MSFNSRHCCAVLECSLIGTFTLRQQSKHSRSKDLAKSISPLDPTVINLSPAWWIVFESLSSPCLHLPWVLVWKFGLSRNLGCKSIPSRAKEKNVIPRKIDRAIPWVFLPFALKISFIISIRISTIENMRYWFYRLMGFTDAQLAEYLMNLWTEIQC